VQADYGQALPAAASSLLSLRIQQHYRGHTHQASTKVLGSGAQACVKLVHLPHTSSCVKASTPSSHSLGGPHGGVMPSSGGDTMAVGDPKRYAAKVFACSAPNRHFDRERRAYEALACASVTPRYYGSVEREGECALLMDVALTSMDKISQVRVATAAAAVQDCRIGIVVVRQCAYLACMLKWAAVKNISRTRIKHA
jgi:hypothetical protein